MAGRKKRMLGRIQEMENVAECLHARIFNLCPQRYEPDPPPDKPYLISPRLRVPDDARFEEVGQSWRHACRLAARLQLELMDLFCRIAQRAGIDTHYRRADTKHLAGLQRMSLPAAIAEYRRHIRELQAAESQAKAQAGAAPDPEPDGDEEHGEDEDEDDEDEPADSELPPEADGPPARPNQQ